MMWNFRRWAIVGVVCLLGTPLARGDAGITVGGVGVAKGKPSVVEIAATVSGDGELAADANVKYTDTKARALAALDALKIANLSVESDGPSISQAVDAATQMRIMQGMGGATPAKQRVQVSEQIRIELKDVDKTPADKLVATVMQILDACHDGGLQVGPPAGNYYQMQVRAQNGTPDTMVTFKIPDASELRDQAYQQAMAEAQGKAKRLAELAGVHLGGVVAVEEQQDFQSQPYNPQGAAVESNGKASDKLAEIPVTVRLTVRFEIAK